MSFWEPLCLLFAAALTVQAESWKVQYFYDRDDSKAVFNDLQFVTDSRGYVAGLRSYKKEAAPRPFLLSTQDGGKTWAESAPSSIPQTIFFVDSGTGWMAGSDGIWRTGDSGQTWKKMSDLVGVTRLWFLSATRGFAIGHPKLMKVTADAGATWTDVKAAQDVNTKAENTTYTSIVFSGRSAVVAGVSQPVRPPPSQPAWVDPSETARRRLLPSLSISIRSSDGGETWTAQTAPVFGTTTRLRINGKVGISIVRYAESFEVPSEVYGVSATGQVQSVYKEKGRIVTDAGWMGANALLVAVEPPGKLNQLPFPGKVHVMRSLDMSNWSEMNVSYKAFAGNAMFAIVDETHAWIATDTGMILNYIP